MRREEVVPPELSGSESAWEGRTEEGDGDLEEQLLSKTLLLIEETLLLASSLSHCLLLCQGLLLTKPRRKIADMETEKCSLQCNYVFCDTQQDIHIFRNESDGKTPDVMAFGIQLLRTDLRVATFQVIIFRVGQ